MLVFYLFCGWSGNIFGAACNPEGSLSVGCQPACFAMFSGLIACFIVNWKALDSIPYIRCPLIFAFVMITMMLLLNSTGTSNYIPGYHPHEKWSDWGGYITGFSLGLVMMPRLRRQATHVGSYEKLCMKIGVGLLVVYFSILLSCFFTVYNPPIRPPYY